MPKLVSRLLGRFAAVAVVCVFACAGVLRAVEDEEGPTPPPEPDRPPVTIEGLDKIPDLQMGAMNWSFNEERGAIVLSGTAWVRYQQIKLEADHIVFFRNSLEAYAEGHIRLVQGESEIAASVAYIDIPNDRGYLIDATVRVSRPSLKERANKDLPARPDPDAGYARATEDQAAFLSPKDPYGVYLESVDDPQGRLNMVFQAEKVIRHSRMHYAAENAFVTTDDMAEPMYGVRIEQLDMYMREAPNPDEPGKMITKPKVIYGKKARLKIGPLVLFPFPTVTYDMTKHAPYMRADVGNSTLFGPFGLYRIGFGLGGSQERLFDPTNLYVDIDLRLKRGPALGAEFKYKTGKRPLDPEAQQAFERGTGSVRVYGTVENFINERDDAGRGIRNRERRIQPKIDGFQHRAYDANLLFLARRRTDDAGPPDFGIDLYEGEARGMIDFSHHQPLRHFIGLNDVQLDFKYQQQSDRDFVLEYFRSNYLTMNQPEALVSARKSGEHYGAELLYRDNANDFDGATPRAPFDFGTFTAYQPAFTYSLLQTPVGHGFYVGGEAQAARLERQFERRVIDQDDFSTERAYGNLTIERPFRFMGATWRPYVGGQAAVYGDSRDGGSTAQAAGMWGLDISSRLYATLPEVRNEELGVDGFRHIIEPRLEYRAVSDPTEDPVNILDFDEIDDVQGLQTVTLALDQTFQTRRFKEDGSYDTHNFAGLNMSLPFFVRSADRDRLVHGNYMDLFHINGYLQVIDALKFNADLGIRFEENEVETASFGLEFDPGGRWRLLVSERFNFSDDDRRILGSDEVRFRLDFQLSERWGLSVEQRTERVRGFLATKGRTYQEIVLRRRYGALIGEISYRVDRNSRDNSFGFSLAPAFAYRNLVVPSQRLVVDAGEVDEEVTPEERNFDPYNLIRRKKKAADTNTGPRRERDVPAPPPMPGSEKSGGGGPDAPDTPAPKVEEPPAEMVPLEPGTAPDAAKPQPGKPLPRDHDDWAVPAKQSASAE